MTGEDLAHAAQGLVGAPFRLHGRTPETGLDCIGLLVAACAAAGRQIILPNGYRLRSRSLPGLAGPAAQAGFAPAAPPLRAGDVAMCRVNPCQHHLVIIASGNSFVHAHAGLGRVVAMHGPLPWPIVGLWRPLSPD